MASCIWDNETGPRTCTVCGWHFPHDHAGPVDSPCPHPDTLQGKPRPRRVAVARVNGPGDHLHDAIARWCGVQPSEGCGCQSKIAQMNAWGPQGCREHLDEIVRWLLEKKPTGRCAAFAKLPEKARAWAIRRMVLLAIGKAESDSGNVVA